LRADDPREYGGRNLALRSLDDHRIDAERLEKLHLVFMSKEHFGRPLWREDPQWMRLKRQYNRTAAELLGIGDGAFNQRLMTQMDTVEIAKSDD
jgi:hypothetical protein